MKDGFLQYSDDLAKVAAKITDARVKKKACEAAGKVLADEALRNAERQLQRRSGRLFKSIIAEYDPVEKAEYVGWGGALNSTKSAHGYYGFFHEYGTSKMRPSPHMRPAMDSKGERALDEMIKVYQNEME